MALAIAGAVAFVVGNVQNGLGAMAALGVVGLALVVGIVGVSRRDAASLLALMLALLFLVPENYVLAGPLKSVGNPAQLVGTLCLGVWGGARILGFLRAHRLHPIRWLFLAFALVTMTAFAAGVMRILTDDEAAGSVRSIFPNLALLGIGLLAVDGLVQQQRLESLLFTLVALGGVAAVIGMLEFAFPGFHYADFAHVPGLVMNNELINDTRSGFHRIDGAAAHPIEYAVALATIAPIALHLGLHARGLWQRHVAKLSFVAILLVNPMTVSRSGFVALAVGLGLYSIQLGRRAKLNALFLGLIGLVLFRAAIPGLLGTIRSLFLIGEGDPSIAGRTEDYAKIPGLMDGHWLFGRGLGTFQPLTYFYLDNQYLGSLLEGGLLELAVFLLILVVGMSLARGARKRSTSAADRGLGQALAAAIAALASSAATFDELSFHQTGFTLFLLVGCAGVYWTGKRHGPVKTSQSAPSMSYDVPLMTRPGAKRRLPAEPHRLVHTATGDPVDSETLPVATTAARAMSRPG